MWSGGVFNLQSRSERDECNRSGIAGDTRPAPSWLDPRPRSVSDAYGIIARPVFVQNVGDPMKNVISGGWRGRPVEIPGANPSERNAELWRVPESGRHKDEFRGARQSAHGWVYAVGPPWLCGRVPLPSGLLLFFADRAKDGIMDALEAVPEPTRSVLQQFEPDRGTFDNNEYPGLCVQPCLLFSVESSTQKGTDGQQRLQRHVKRIELYDSAVRRRNGICGLFVSCGCDRPGSLQCTAYAGLLETLIDDAIGGKKFSRLEITTSSDGAILTSTWVTSGPTFFWADEHWKKESVPRANRGHRYVRDWSILP
nr:protein LORF4 [Psittacid alphaherpesvirus 6]